MNTTDIAAPEHVGWVSPQGGRSTWGILWSCFTVFLICSWKCVHLNLPSPKESTAGWYRFHGVPIWPSAPLARKWRRKFIWMGIFALAPELVVGIASNQFFEAREELKRAGSDEFTLTHAFFSNMGGYILRFYIHGNQRIERRGDEQVVVPETKGADIGSEMVGETTRSPRQWVIRDEEGVVEAGRTPPFIIVSERDLDLWQIGKSVTST